MVLLCLGQSPIQSQLLPSSPVEPNSPPSDTLGTLRWSGVASMCLPSVFGGGGGELPSPSKRLSLQLNYDYSFCWLTHTPLTRRFYQQVKALTSGPLPTLARLKQCPRLLVLRIVELTCCQFFVNCGPVNWLPGKYAALLHKQVRPLGLPLWLDFILNNQLVLS